MGTVVTESDFLKAFEGTNRQVPVWFMRQAGRYLPEYQAIRKKLSLDEMFKRPDIVADVTCQPVDILGVDAAILFADILSLPQAMGFDIHFDKLKGPVIGNPLETTSDIERLHDFTGLEYVAESIKRIKARLGSQTPLIGFAGSPFTVLSYLIEGGSSQTFAKFLAFVYQDSSQYHTLMQKLTDNTVEYLKMQQSAGIDVFQLFDTWAGILPPKDYKELIFPYVKQVFERVDLRSIYFVKNTKPFLKDLSELRVDFISVCHSVDFGRDEELSTIRKGIQGNFFNGYLHSENEVIKREVVELLTAAKRFKKYIFNLNHGVTPNVDPEKLKLIVREVHQFKWRDNE